MGRLNDACKTPTPKIRARRLRPAWTPPPRSSTELRWRQLFAIRASSGTPADRTALLGQLAQAGDGLGAVGAGEGLAQGLGAAVVEVGVLVVEAAEGRGVVAAVGVVGLFEAHDVDLAVGQLGAAVAGVAGGLGGPIDGLAALGLRARAGRTGRGRGSGDTRACRGRRPGP